MATTENPTMEELMEGLPLDVQDSMATIFNIGFNAGVEIALETVSAMKSDLTRRARLSLMPVNRQEMEMERLHMEALAENVRRTFEGLTENPEMPFDAPIEDLQFTIRTYTSLKRSNIHLVGELLQQSVGALFTIRNFGYKAMAEVTGTLGECGYALTDDTTPRDTSNDINFES